MNGVFTEIDWAAETKDLEETLAADNHHLEKAVETRPEFHYHNCPKCYAKFECHIQCTLEPELKEGDKHFGNHCPCFKCEPLQGYDGVGKKLVKYSADWFKLYNGVR